MWEGLDFSGPTSRLVSGRQLILLDCLTLSSGEHFEILDSGSGSPH